MTLGTEPVQYSDGICWVDLLWTIVENLKMIMICLQNLSKELLLFLADPGMYWLMRLL